MDINTLKKSLSWFCANASTTNIVVYALTEKDSNLLNIQCGVEDTTEPLNICKLDIEQTALPQLQNMLLNKLTDKIISQEELSLLNVSTADERGKALYRYDLEAEWSILNAMKSLTAPKTLLPCVSLDKIYALLFKIGNDKKQVVIYQNVAPIQILKPSQFFVFFNNKHRLKKVDKDLLRVTGNFQIIYIENELIIVSLDFIEKHAGFHQVVRREAAKGISAISQMSIVENMDTFEPLLDKPSFARKLSGLVKDSPVLKAQISTENILEFCKTSSALQGKFKFNKDGTKLVLRSLAAKKAFLNLMLDNYLTSELTKFVYEILAKDPISPEKIAGS